MLLQAVGQVDALAVLVEPHQYRHVGGRDAADAQVHCIDQPIKAVGGIQFTTDQFVAQVGPRALALEVQGQSVRLSEALGGSHHQRCAIAQGHEAQIEAAFSGASLPLTQASGSLAGLLPTESFIQHLPFRSQKSAVPSDGAASHCG